MKNNKIIVIDDERNVRRIVADFLINEGYEVIEAESGEEGVDKVMAHPDASLVLLDIRMPKMDGYETIEEIRQFSEVPVIFLTALNDSFDEAKGINLGADDYISKPFSYNVLLARVRSCIRRNTKEIAETFTTGALSINFNNRQLFIEGKDRNLTQKEFDLMELLVRNVGQTIDRDTLLDRVWGYDYEGDTMTLNTHMKTLRTKLGAYSKQIKTVRGIGYRFEINN